MKPHSKYLLGLDSFVEHYFLLESFMLLCVGVVSSFLLPDHIPLYEWFVAGLIMNYCSVFSWVPLLPWEYLDYRSSFQWGVDVGSGPAHRNLQHTILPDPSSLSRPEMIGVTLEAMCGRWRSLEVEKPWIPRSPLGWKLPKKASE